MLVTLKVGCAPAHPWKVLVSPQPSWGGGGARGEVPFSGEPPYKLPLPWVIVVGLMGVVCGCVVHTVPKSGHRYRVEELSLEEEEQAIQPSEPILSFSWNISNCHYLKLFPLVSRFHGPGRVPHSFVRTFFQLSLQLFGSTLSQPSFVSSLEEYVLPPSFAWLQMLGQV